MGELTYTRLPMKGCTKSNTSIVIVWNVNSRVQKSCWLPGNKKSFKCDDWSMCYYMYNNICIIRINVLFYKRTKKAIARSLYIYIYI
jgi:hypothetical protein